MIRMGTLNSKTEILKRPKYPRPGRFGLWPWFGFRRRFPTWQFLTLCFFSLLFQLALLFLSLLFQASLLQKTLPLLLLLQAPLPIQTPLLQPLLFQLPLLLQPLLLL